MPAKTCIVIAGPTAVGKTSWSLKLATHWGTEIISADSRQCYRELNIGVAKPPASYLQLIPHYFINSHTITEEVNAGIFEEYALQSTMEIFSRHSHAIMVGGTGLYIDAFCKGMDAMPEVDTAIRRGVRKNYELHGMGWLQESVKENDPHYYSIGEIQNPHRLMRALEIKLSSGKSILDFQLESKKKRPFHIIKIGFELPREELYRNINNRVDEMMRDGLLHEVEGLTSYRNFNSLSTVGYKELFEYLDGNCTLEFAVDAIKKNTRHYAKRQLTWFKRDNNIRWFSPHDSEEKVLQWINDQLLDI